MLLKKGLILFIFGVLALSCARIVMPPGGPDDKSAPVIQKMSPEDRSTQFYSDKVQIDFDEYVVLKNFNQEFVSSPLFKEKPEKILRGKSLILKFDKDSLEPNTTYTLDFGNSIVDFRAGNILPNYQYVFSTGDVVDSLSISGHVFWAEDLSPQEQIWVLLYKNYTDTTLATTRPDFVAKTDKDGHFSINNIAAGTYGMAALKDINNNYIYDLPNEQIAFLDTVFELELHLGHDEHNCHNHDLDSIMDPLSFLDSLDTDTTFIINDTLVQLESDSVILTDSVLVSVDSSIVNSDTLLVIDDSLSLSTDTTLVVNDSLITDSLDTKIHYHTSPNHIDLFLFEEYNQNIYLSEDSRPNPHLINLVFSESTDSIVAFEFLAIDSANVLVEASLNKDTFDIWLLDTLLSKNDTLEMYVGYNKTDSMQNLQWSWDTLVLKNPPKKEIKPKKKKDNDTLPEPKVYLEIEATAKAKQSIDFYKQLRIKSPFPIEILDTAKIHLYEQIDSNFTPLAFSIARDSIKIREYVLDYQFEAEKDYRIELEPEAFIDYRNLSNDTLDIDFKTKALDVYTEILLHVSGTDSSQVIVELFDSKSKKLKTEIINHDQQLKFSYLKPGDYTCKAILDINNNGKWDTGDYELKIQAEKVTYYSEPISTKANWTHEIQWQLNFGMGEH
jgi:uncharacterized protein (DUF2141 family)